MTEQPPLEQPPADYRALLIAARTRSGLTHDEISKAIGLRPAYLETLELGTLGSTLSQPYVLSMLTLYGAHLGLDPDVLLRSYEVEVGPSLLPTSDAAGRPPGQPTDRQAAGRSKGSRRRSKRKRRSLWPALGVVLAAVAIGGVLVDPLGLDLVGQIGKISFAEGTTDGRPSITTTASTIAVATATTTATTSSPPSTSTTTPKKHTVRIVPMDDVWLELTSQSGATVLFRGMRKAGKELTFSVLGPLKATVGRPEAVKVFLNGEQTSLPRAALWLITATGVHERSSG